MHRSVHQIARASVVCIMLFMAILVFKVFRETPAKELLLLLWNELVLGAKN